VSAERFSLFFVPVTTKIVQNKVIDKISELAESVLTTTDFFLVDVEIKGGDTPEVWVSVDAKDRGVNMDECAEISNELGFVMDAHDIFSGQYRINVSSPGLNRPLVDRRQYPKNIGRKAKFKYKTDGEYSKVEGTLKEVTEEHIGIELDDDTIITVPFDDLVETKIIPSFK
jgi:ribosome maturation factor RimP